MQLETEFSQAHLLKPAVDHIQRRHLLRDEEHGSSLGQGVRNHVGNGLGFARSGRTDEHEILLSRASGHRRQLRGIGRQDGAEAIGREFFVQPRGLGKLLCALEGMPRAFRQMADDPVGQDLIRALHQILPHEVFGEGEGAENHVFQYRKSFDAFGLPANPVPHGGDIQATLVRRQKLIESVDGETEILPQHLQQGGVEARLVLVKHHPHPGAHASPFERHRNQNQRRFEVTLAFVVPLPAQKAQHQEQRICAALQQIRPRRSVEIDKSSGQLDTVELDHHLVALEGFRGQAASPASGGLRGRGLLGLTLHVAGFWRRRDELYPRSGVELLRQRQRVGTKQRQRPPGRLEVEQSVVQGKVQQPTLPARQSSFRFLPGALRVPLRGVLRLVSCLDAAIVEVGLHPARGQRVPAGG